MQRHGKVGTVLGNKWKELKAKGLLPFMSRIYGAIVAKATKERGTALQGS